MGLSGAQVQAYWLNRAPSDTALVERGGEWVMSQSRQAFGKREPEPCQPGAVS